MKSTQYSEKVIDHFTNPRNVGTLIGPNIAMGRVGNPVCGDLMEIYIKVEDEIITDIKFKTFGCGSAVATSSMITEMVKGKTLDEALKVTRKDVADELDGLPPVKMHCSNLAADALHAAIREYRKKGKTPPETTTTVPDDLKLSDEEIKSIGSGQSLNGDQAIIGMKEYKGKGLYTNIDDLTTLKGKRVLILHASDDAIAMAIELTKYTGRVILVTSVNDISTEPALKKKLLRSDVKVLYESRILEISGEGEVEKAKIHDLDEDEDYELFIDAAIILPGSCH